MKISVSVLLMPLFAFFGIIFISVGIDKMIAYGFFGIAIVIGLIELYKIMKKKKQ